MRLKLFRAASVSEAMARIRAELGPEALILSTRRVGDGVEVTAAMEPADAEPEPVPRPARIRAVPAGTPRGTLLAWHGVPAALAAQLQAGLLDAALARALHFETLDFDAGPLLLTGPPGAGKTLTIARLATRLVMAGAPPMVITADGRRAGATEQLAAFTRLLGLTLIVASNPVTLGRALIRRQAGAPVLVDAPGTDPFDPAEREEIAAMAAAIGAVTALVLPAGGDACESADLACAFAEQGASMMIATRLDLARRLGGVLAAAQGAGLALTEAGVGPGAADGLAPLTPAFLAARLIRAAPRADAAPDIRTFEQSGPEMFS